MPVEFVFVGIIKFRDWTRVEEDCRKAIQLDHDSVKVLIFFFFFFFFFCFGFPSYWDC